MTTLRQPYVRTPAIVRTSRTPRRAARQLHGKQSSSGASDISYTDIGINAIVAHNAKFTANTLLEGRISNMRIISITITFLFQKK